MKITAQALAEKIAELTNESHRRSAADILEAVPELAGFDTLAKAVEGFYQGAQMALHDGADADVEEMRDEYLEVYREAVGEDPEEPVLENRDDEDDEVEDLETAPTESEQ